MLNHYTQNLLFTLNPAVEYRGELARILDLEGLKEHLREFNAKGTEALEGFLQGVHFTPSEIEALHFEGIDPQYKDRLYAQLMQRYFKGVPRNGAMSAKEQLERIVTHMLSILKKQEKIPLSFEVFFEIAAGRKATLLPQRAHSEKEKRWLEAIEFCTYKQKPRVAQEVLRNAATFYSIAKDYPSLETLFNNDGNVLLSGKGNLSFSEDSFLFYVEHGHIQKVREFKDHPFTTEIFEKALIKAAGKGHLRLVKLLLEGPCSAVSTTCKGQALRSATKSGHLEMVIFLLEKIGEQLTKRNTRYIGQMLTEASMISGHLDIVEFLVKSSWWEKADFRDQKIVMAFAANNGNQDLVELILEKTPEKEIGDTALIAASKYGHKDLVEFLLGYPGLSITSQKGIFLERPIESAFQEAAKTGRKDVVELLLDNASKEISPRIKGYALSNASAEGYTKVVALLLERVGKEISPEMKGEAFWRASDSYTYRREEGSVIELLVECVGEEISVKDKEHAFKNLATKGAQVRVEWMIKHPLWQQISENCKGETFEAVAALGREYGMVNFLLNTIGKEIPAIYKGRVLCLATKHRVPSVVSLLLNLCNDLPVEAIKEALAIAKQNKDVAIEAMLAAKLPAQEQPLNAQQEVIVIDPPQKPQRPIPGKTAERAHPYPRPQAPSKRVPVQAKAPSVGQVAAVQPTDRRSVTPVALPQHPPAQRSSGPMAAQVGRQNVRPAPYSIIPQFRRMQSSVASTSVASASTTILGSIEPQALYDAAEGGDLETVRCLMRLLPVSLEHTEETLRRAAAHGKLQVVEFLITEPSRYPIRPEAKGQALCAAVENKHVQVVSYLFSSCPDMPPAFQTQAFTLAKQLNRAGPVAEPEGNKPVIKQEKRAP